MATATQTFQVRGMDCANCAQTVEKGVGRLDGVEQCDINFTTEKLTVQGDVGREQIVARIRELGYDVAAAGGAPQTTSAPPNFLQFMWQRLETRLALFGAALILPGLIFTELGGFEHPAIHAASVAAMLVAGWPIAKSAWRAVAINREITMNLLMSVAAVGAVLIGAYTEAGMVMVLFAIGEALEGYTADRARHSIRSLMEVIPSTAVRLGPGSSEAVVDVAELAIGDVLLVKPGERIPMDGRVIAGTSAVNQAPITGESQLVEKRAGDELFASSINGAGALEIEVTRLAEDNTISRVIKMVEEAQEKQAPAQRFVDQFARYYTPTVMVLAFLTATVPPLFFGQPFLNPADGSFGWLYRGLALLVVACPCALVISTPVSIISAISNGARNGVLFKGGAHVEALSRVDALALDKTGTLTQGRPSVVAVRAAECGDGECAACDDVLALASAVERRSEHPLAHAIISKATERGVAEKYATAADVTALTGRGVTGRVNGYTVTIGSHTYFEEHVRHNGRQCAEAQADAAQGYTPMMVSANGEYVGTISVADTLRASSQAAVEQLKQIGLKTIVMLTGDNRQTAEAVAQQVGVTDVRPELLPEDKVAAVERLRRQYGSVAMVGDGINDAPALATADVGIALGGSSTTQAMETADVTLMSDDLRQLPFALRLSRATMGIIRANVVLSIGIKLLFLVLVVLGLGTMWMAVLADMGTSLLVTLNGMRLLRRRYEA